MAESSDDELDALLACPELEKQLEEIRAQASQIKTQRPLSDRRGNINKAPSDNKIHGHSIADTLLNRPDPLQQLEELENNLDSELQSWRNTVGDTSIEQHATGYRKQIEPYQHTDPLQTKEIEEEIDEPVELPPEPIEEEIEERTREPTPERTRAEPAEEAKLTELDREILQEKEELNIVRAELSVLHEMYPDGELSEKVKEEVTEKNKRVIKQETLDPAIETLAHDTGEEDASMLAEIEKLQVRLNGLEVRKKVHSEYKKGSKGAPTHILEQNKYLKELFRGSSKPMGLINLKKELFQDKNVL